MRLRVCSLFRIRYFVSDPNFQFLTHWPHMTSCQCRNWQLFSKLHEMNAFLTTIDMMRYKSLFAIKVDSKPIYWWVFLHIKIKSPNLIHFHNLQGIIFLTLEFMACLLTMLLKGLARKHFQFKLMAKKTQLIHVIKWHKTWNWNLLFILPVKKNAPVSPILQVILSGSMSFN